MGRLKTHESTQKKYRVTYHTQIASLAVKPKGRTFMHVNDIIIYNLMGESRNKSVVN